MDIYRYSLLAFMLHNDTIYESMISCNDVISDICEKGCDDHSVLGCV